jgi:hypothetical protein
MKEMSASRIKHMPMKTVKTKISLKKKRAPAASTSATRKKVKSSSPTKNENAGQVYNMQHEYSKRRNRMESRLSDEV